MTSTALVTHDPVLQLSAADVARLTWPARLTRLAMLTIRAREIVDYAVTVSAGGREVTAIVVLFSGGNDSTVLAHLFRERATHAAHANTTVGIEQTREFVRATAAELGLPLIEKVTPSPYEELVLASGFPGPGHHWKMYQRLKERALRLVQRELGLRRARVRRGVYLAGRRRDESRRRAAVPLHERDGAMVWASPLAEWTKLDLNTYRLVCRDVPVNAVSDVLHMSGECLCGSFAKPGERDEIAAWYPEAWAPIAALEEKLADRDDLPAHAKRWGWGATRIAAERGSHLERRIGALCSSCEGEAP